MSIFLIGIILVLVIIIALFLTNKKNKSRDAFNEIMTDKESIQLEEEISKKEQGYQKLELELIRAGIPLKAREFTFFKIVSTAIVLLSMFFLTKNFILTVIFTGAWLFVPNLILSYFKAKRKENFEKQLQPAVSLIRNSVESGFNILQAMGIVAEEMDAPISEEFTRVLHECNIGKDLDVALYNILNRMPSEELKLFITAVLIQKEVGGNLNEILEVILQTIKDRLQIKRELKTLTAQGKLSALIVTLLPVVLAFFLYIINPEYMSPLFTNPLGKIMIGVAILGELVGLFFISKIIKIDF